MKKSILLSAFFCLFHTHTMVAQNFFAPRTIVAQKLFTPFSLLYSYCLDILYEDSMLPIHKPVQKYLEQSREFEKKIQYLSELSSIPEFKIELTQSVVSIRRSPYVELYNLDSCITIYNKNQHNQGLDETIIFARRVIVFAQVSDFLQSIEKSTNKKIPVFYTDIKNKTDIFALLSTLEITREVHEQ